MNNRILLIIVCLVWLSSVVAQQTAVIPSSYVAGNASVAYQDEWLPFNNPAALGRMGCFGVGIIYENRYISPKLATKSINTWLPTKHINIGVGFSQFGYSEYNEMLASLSFGRKFGDRFSLGAEAVYYTMFISSVSRYRGTLTAQVGAQVDLSDNFSLAFKVFNPTFSTVKGEHDKKALPTVLSLGSQYKIRQVVLWLVQFDKEITSPLRWATGFHYSVAEEFIVRIGAYGYNDFRPTIGAGIRLDNWRFNLSADYNSVLGFSLLGSIGYKL